MQVGTRSGVKSPGMVISSALGGTSRGNSSLTSDKMSDVLPTFLVKLFFARLANVERACSLRLSLHEAPRTKAAMWRHRRRRCICWNYEPQMKICYAHTFICTLSTQAGRACVTIANMMVCTMAGVALHEQNRWKFATWRARTWIRSKIIKNFFENFFYHMIPLEDPVSQPGDIQKKWISGINPT